MQQQPTISIPTGSSPASYTTIYDKFRGVDMSTDPALIDTTRSPDAPNLISDTGGYPEKRHGWKTVVEQPKADYTAGNPGRVNGIHRAVLSSGEVRLVHIGTKLYQWTGWDTAAETLTALTGAYADARSTSFTCAGKLWILTGSEYLVYDGQTIADVSTVAYAPLTTFSAPPAGGGQTLESVNLLTPKRRNAFQADGTSKDYQLDTAPISGVSEVKVNGTVQETGAYTVDLTAGKVKFSTAPAKPTITGEDNVEIAFTATVEGYADTIRKCRFAASYGFGGDMGERIFFSGHPDKPNVDWHCEIHAPDYRPDPAYVPDTSFAYIGSDANAVMGYRRINQYQAILKSTNSADATVFLRSAGTDANGKAVFSISQGVAGAGAAGMYSIANLGDEGLFLSETGITGIASQDMGSHYALQNRSYFIDAQLTKEPNLAEAAAVEWNGYYLLALNGRCYVLDGKQYKSYKPQSRGDYVYECYYWTNIPARCWLECGGSLWFGTPDGRICRFKTDETGMSRFSDDGAAIPARWATKADDDGNFALLKSIPLRGTAIMIKPYTRSGASVAIRTDHDFGVSVKSERTNIFDFSDIDFDSFTFETNDSPQVIPMNRKIKRYKTCQIVVENNKPNEGFGVYGIVKRFQKLRPARI